VDTGRSFSGCHGFAVPHLLEREDGGHGLALLVRHRLVPHLSPTRSEVISGSRLISPSTPSAALAGVCPSWVMDCPRLLPR
jgi:hypothetical protein